MTCGIYMIKNKINGHMYIGLSGNIEKRWQQHIEASYRERGKEYNLPLHKAIRKLGKDQFEFIILEECKQEDLPEKEKYYIKKFNTYENPEHYNLDAGGNGRTCGYKHTEETKEKMRKNHADFSGGKHPEAKSVYCIEKNISFNSCGEMAEFLGFDYVQGGKNIARVARGERYSYKNLHFIWENERTDDKIQQALQKPNSGIPKQVKCIETDKVYKNIKEASKDTGADASSISKVCKGQQKTAGKLHWKYHKGDKN